MIDLSSNQNFQNKYQELTNPKLLFKNYMVESIYKENYEIYNVIIEKYINNTYFLPNYL